MSFLDANCQAGGTGDAINECWQIQHGTYALANGGVFGVGLGNSAAKWSWLPAADNDFIFAIIGEELGLIGAVVVIGLFVLLAVAFVRMMRSARTPFAKAATAAVLVWVIGQACVNIGVVLGVFPILGVPLPLVSAGGTALLTTMFAIGIVLSFARDPGAPARAAARAAARKAANGGARDAMTVYLLAGGGTAGHVNPLLAVADRLRERDPDAEVLVLGTAEGLEARLVPARGLRAPDDREGAVPAAARTVRPSHSRRDSAQSIADVRRIIDERDVDVVVGFGGYVSTPAYLAARRAGIPVAIHEANAKPGLANRLGARSSRRGRRRLRRERRCRARDRRRHAAASRDRAARPQRTA